MVTSTFDEYVAAVMGDNVVASLPTITKDLADTWVWGMGSDPYKTQVLTLLPFAEFRPISFCRPCEPSIVCEPCVKRLVIYINYLNNNIIAAGQQG